MPSAKVVVRVSAVLFFLGTMNMARSSKVVLPKQHVIHKQSGTAGTGSLGAVLQYISNGWDHLTRSMTNCSSYQDTKTDGHASPILYVPAGFSSPPFAKQLQEQCGVRVEDLPRKITRPGDVDLAEIPGEGLLYLENPYVVPGGRFNEMYGWDSYFIIRGLLRENRRALAKGMIENFFFEIENYGSILNANRTYYLTRSQPPFLSSMILAMYDADQSAGQPDLKWLARAYTFASRDYGQWTHSPHLAGNTGLSRYFDHGSGPVPEIEGDPDEYYRDAARYFLIHEDAGKSHLDRVYGEASKNSLVEPSFTVFVCDSQPGEPANKKCGPADRVALTADYYKGDRSMRESGFDVSFRFGPFGADTHHYAPVCLNSLLYKTERDLEKMSLLLGRRKDAQLWNTRALARRKKMTQYLWDERRGMFFDYNFETRQRSTYEYATTFYPLWAGVATKAQARALARNLKIFEQPGGIVMSRTESEAQWDYPYGWAPIQLLTVEGLLKYGYKAAANRVALHFLTMVMENFERDKTIREKYNVVTRSSETHIEAGYHANEIGFGWTNGVFAELLNELPGNLKANLEGM